MTERRSAPRIPVKAEVRLRPAGSSGRSITCSVLDSSASGIRMRCLEDVDPAWYWVELLTSTGTPAEEPIEARVVWRDTDDAGYQEVGCSFDE